MSQPTFVQEDDQESDESMVEVEESVDQIGLYTVMVQTLKSQLLSPDNYAEQLKLSRQQGEEARKARERVQQHDKNLEEIAKYQQFIDEMSASPQPTVNVAQEYAAVSKPAIVQEDDQESDESMVEVEESVDQIGLYTVMVQTLKSQLLSPDNYAEQLKLSRQQGEEARKASERVQQHDKNLEEIAKYQQFIDELKAMPEATSPAQADFIGEVSPLQSSPPPKPQAEPTPFKEPPPSAPLRSASASKPSPDAFRNERFEAKIAAIQAEFQAEFEALL